VNGDYLALTRSIPDDVYKSWNENPIPQEPNSDIENDEHEDPLQASSSDYTAIPGVIGI
jgi:hypothetical protein